MPPVVFDLGAQRDRVVAAGFGVVVPRALVDRVGDLNDLLLGLRDAAPPDAAPHDRPPAASYPDVLADYYGLAPATRPVADE